MLQIFLRFPYFHQLSESKVTLSAETLGKTDYFIYSTLSLKIIFLPITSIISFGVVGLKYVTGGGSKCSFNSGR